MSNLGRKEAIAFFSQLSKKHQINCFGRLGKSNMIEAGRTRVYIANGAGDKVALDLGNLTVTRPIQNVRAGEKVEFRCRINAKGRPCWVCDIGRPMQVDIDH